MKRKSFALVIALLMMLSPLAANLAAAQSLPVVTLAYPTNATCNIITTYIPQIEETLGIKINLEPIAEASYAEKLILNLASGANPYEVFWASPNHFGQLLESGWAQPLDEFINDDKLTTPQWRAGLSDASLDMLLYQGQRYGIPHESGVSLIYYNKSILKAAGLDPENPPSTLEEVLAAAEKINDPDKNQYGISFRASRESNANTFLWAMLWMAVGGSWENEDGTANYDNIGGQAAIDATRYFAEFSKFAPKGIASYTYEEAMTAFQRGLVGLYIDTSILASSILDPEQSQVVEDVGFQAFTEGSCIGAPWMVMMAKNTQNKDAAWKLMQYLTGYEFNMNMVKKGEFSGTVRTDILESPDVDQYINPDLAKALVDSYTRGVETNYFPAIRQTPEIRTAIAIAISDAAQGSITPEEAVSNIHKATVEILKRDGVTW